MKKRLVSLLLVLCLALGCIPMSSLAAGGEPFRDVPVNSWYTDAVQYVYDNGIMSGTTDTTFGPNLATTRGMIVTVLHRMEGEPAASASTFDDVPSGKWFSNAVAWANENGIVKGYSYWEFGPHDIVTREQLATIMYRYAAYKWYDTTTVGNLSQFSDNGKISGWARTALSWANGVGLINGKGNNRVDPKGSATRAELAAILERFERNIAGEGNQSDSAVDFWEEFVSTRSYLQYTRDWQDSQNDIIEKYAIFDINADGWEELIVSTSTDMVGFALYSVFSCDKETKKVSLIPIEQPFDEGKNNFHSYGQYRRGIQYSPKYRAIFYELLNNGTMGPFVHGFWALEDGSLWNNCTIYHEPYDHVTGQIREEPIYSAGEFGIDKDLSKAEYDSYLEGLITIPFKDVNSLDESGSSSGGADSASEWTFYNLDEMGNALVSINWYDISGDEAYVSVNKELFFCKYENGYQTNEICTVVDGKLITSESSGPVKYYIEDENFIRYDDGMPDFCYDEKITSMDRDNFVVFVDYRGSMVIDWLIPYSLIDWSRGMHDDPSSGLESDCILYLVP